MLRVMYRNGDSDDGETMALAMAHAVQLAQENKWPIHFTYNQKNSFPPSDLSKIYDEKQLNKLTKGIKLNLSNKNIVLDYYPPKDIAYNKLGLIFAPYLTFEMLNEFDAISDAQCIVFLPWSNSDGDKWENAWPEVQVMNAEPLKITQLPEEVEKVLMGLDYIINKHGLHPSDKKKIKSEIQELKKQGHELNYELIEGWLVRHRWSNSIRPQLLNLI